MADAVKFAADNVLPVNDPYAIKYAEKKDVLFVHAAGNDGDNIDLDENANFPNDSDDNKFFGDIKAM